MRCGRVDKEKTDAVWHPFFCDPGGIQTRDLQNRNLTLYSAKLPGLLRGKSKHFFLVCHTCSTYSSPSATENKTQMFEDRLLTSVIMLHDDETFYERSLVILSRDTSSVVQRMY